MSTGDSEGPAWNKFWLSLDHESESMVSGDGSHRPHTPGHRSLISPDMPSSRPAIDRVDSVLPNDSASHNGGDDSHSDFVQQESSPQLPEDSPFPFKFKAPSGRVHRLQVTASTGLAGLISSVTAKLGSEINAVGGEASFEDGKIGRTGYALSYLDNEGDTVSITTDQDLLDAITLARKSLRDKVDLFVHDPEKAPMQAATTDPHPGLSKPLTPPASIIKERRKQMVEEDEDGEDEMETPVKRKKGAKGQVQAGQGSEAKEQLVKGVPNELLLPGAITVLAVVIVGVFVIGRAGKK